MIKLDKDLVNDLFGILNEVLENHNWSKSGNKVTSNVVLTEEMFDEGDTDYYNPEFISLVGYTVKCLQEGDHRNDGQMVDYRFTFISPEGKKTVIETEMCLMVGWNYWEDVEIK
jgi:hypothetical protein